MTAGELLQVQRLEHVLDELRRKGAVRVRELAVDLGVSEPTIRRDIATLAARHLVTRVHGGATLPQHARPSGRPPQTSRAFTIGMVVPSLDFYWPPVVAGAKAAAGALGVTIQLRGSSYDPEEDRRQIGRLVDAQQVQGLLLAPSLDTGDAERMMRWIGRLPVPTVLVERQPRHWAAMPRRVEYVRSDHSLGLEIAVHHLYEHGHRRIALMLAHGSPTSEHLLRGWLTACAELGISAATVVREPVALDDPGHRRLIHDSLIRCRRAAVTALIVHSDPHAIAVVQICAELGIGIPEDLAMVSYDDEIAHLAEPALTAVRPLKNHVGRVAVELMVSRLHDGDRRPAHGVIVAPELVVRQSSLSRARLA
ncbi:LacI family transcriptional regulator [Actinoplanes cyaneus]|uniref:LacI family transcriptional regulator n=1 Tax=Actinoplanes cyaneus TaxID=52696 RepID=A0A919MBM3_9ACTN|nr:LacI family DNA-binding transcriptional regulator [Actinoplanes cyaneus]MCW2142418.1 DNA-binding transcriptional regulator, LacI/PurR family [Actinoplanes cyaneus]GID65226.1 LacI family transcriptional regulator [Actinoplanes cyaneus]